MCIYGKKFITNSLEDLKMSLLNFSFVMIYVIRKMLLLPKNHVNFLKDNIFESFLKKYNKILFFKKTTFFIIYNDEKFKAWRKIDSLQHKKSF